MTARGFNTTDGVGTTDAIVTACKAAPPRMTLSIRFTRRSVGGGSIGRLWQKATTGDTGPKLFAFSAPPDELRLLYPWTGSAGGNAEWRITAPAASATTWHTLTITYDESSTSNDPAFWIDSVLQTATEAVAPSGTPNQGSEAWVIGNRKSDSIRVWDGILADFAVWSVCLPQSAIQDMHVNRKSPLWYPSGLICYLTDYLQKDWFGSAPVLTGTKPQAAPGIVQPPWAQSILHRLPFIGAAT